MTPETRPAEVGTEAMHYELQIDGDGWRMSTCPQPTGTPLEVVLTLLKPNLYKLRGLPDSYRVRLLNCRAEEYLPPRCRKPRTRYVYDTVATFTVGELRPQLIEKAKETFGKVPDGWL
jgi:hypothetical protein